MKIWAGWVKSIKYWSCAILWVNLAYLILDLWWLLSVWHSFGCFTSTNVTWNQRCRLPQSGQMPLAATWRSAAAWEDGEHGPQNFSDALLAPGWHNIRIHFFRLFLRRFKYHLPSGNSTWLLKMAIHSELFPVKKVIFHSYGSHYQREVSCESINQSDDGSSR